MDFATWLAAHDFDAETLTDKQRELLKAHYEAEINSDAGGDGSPGDAGDDFVQIIAKQKAENARKKAINMLVAQYAGEHPDQIEDIEKLGAAAIKAKTDPEKFELELLRACRPVGPSNVRPATPGGVNARVLEAAVCLAGRLRNIDKHYDPRTLEAADQTFRSGIGLNQVLLVAARMNGYDDPYHSRVTLDAQRAAFGMRTPELRASGFSTLNVSGVLSNIANKFLLEGWGAGDMAWAMIAARRPVRDFKTVSRYRLGGNLTYEKVGPGGELKHGLLTEDTYTNKADTYGRLFAITREDIVNDDLGALTQVPFELGVAGIDAFNDIFWTEFLNNSAFFTAGNNNVRTGADSALTHADALRLAEAVFLNQTKPNGKPLAVMPSILLAPPTLKATAMAAMNSQFLITGANTTLPNVNVFVGRFAVASSPYMENSTFTGFSAAAWYLLADPVRMAVIEAVFLNGREAPTVETADADFNVLGIQMRGYHDFGVNLQEPRGGVRSAGS